LYLWFEIRRRKLPVRMAALLPGAIVLAVFGAGMSYYCWRVTGNPIELPQMAYIKQYAVTKAFVWQKAPPPPVFRHAILEAQLQSFELSETPYNSPIGTLLLSLVKAMRIGAFYLGPLMLVPLAMIPWLIRGRFRGLLFIAGASVMAILLTVPLELHYAAPMSGIFYLTTVQSLRRRIRRRVCRLLEHVGRFEVNPHGVRRVGQAPGSERVG